MLLSVIEAVEPLLMSDSITTPSRPHNNLACITCIEALHFVVDYLSVEIDTVVMGDIPDLECKIDSIQLLMINVLRRNATCSATYYMAQLDAVRQQLAAAKSSFKEVCRLKCACSFRAPAPSLAVPTFATCPKPHGWCKCPRGCCYALDAWDQHGLCMFCDPDGVDCDCGCGCPGCDREAVL